MPRLLENHNFAWILVAMVGLLVTGAYSREAHESITVIFIQVTGIGLLLLSLLSLKGHHTWPKWLLIIVSLIVVMTLVRHTTGQHHLDYLYLGLMLVFLVSASWLVGGHVLLTGSVDLNKLIGTVALYLMIGLIWAVLYTMVLIVWPDAFHGIESGNWYDNLAETTYFSFVTLTTLGYGDISPARPIAEVLVVLEAVIGMFYVATVVASLVGAMISRRSR
mgnify:FL=1